MNTKLILIATLSVALCFGCGTKSETTETKIVEKTTETAAEMPKTAEAPKTNEGAKAKIDVVTAMQGKWQSLDDPKSKIEVKGNQLSSLYEGKVVSTEKIDVSAASITTCKASAEGDMSGLTIFMTQGELDATCYALIHADEKSLEYSVLGGAGNTLRYKKI